MLGAAVDEGLGSRFGGVKEERRQGCGYGGLVGIDKGLLIQTRPNRMVSASVHWALSMMFPNVPRGMVPLGGGNGWAVVMDDNSSAVRVGVGSAEASAPAEPSESVSLPCSHAPMLPCSHAPCSHAPMLPCSHAPMLPCSHAPMLPCSHAPMLPCSHAPTIALTGTFLTRKRLSRMRRNGSGAQKWHTMTQKKYPAPPIGHIVANKGKFSMTPAAEFKCGCPFGRILRRILRG